MELTDLELCKKIAEIDKIKYTEGGHQYYEHWIYRVPQITGLPPVRYDPIQDKATCFDLMNKYRICLISMESDLKDGPDSYTCYEQGSPVGFVNYILSENLNPQRAILLAIVAKFEAVK